MAKKKSTPTPEEEKDLMEMPPGSEELSAGDDISPTDSAENTPVGENDADTGGEALPVEAGSDDTASVSAESVEETPNVIDADSVEDPPPESDGPTETAVEEESDDPAYASLLQELGDHPLSAGNDEEGDTDRASEEDVLLLPDEEDEPPAEDEGGPTEDAPIRDAARPRMSAAMARRRERILTIYAKAELQTEEDREATLWHEVQNAYRTRRILTGTLDGVEKMESGLTLAVVNYKGFRVAIPMKEMLLYNGKRPRGMSNTELMDRLNRMLSARLGAEIDFVVKGIHNASRSIVASRRDAMYRKRQTFYLDTDDFGEYMIYEGRVVQARVVAVAEKVIRVEVFGVECTIKANALSWEWMGNAREHFSVGDRILVRVLQVNRSSVEDLTIEADVKSVSATTNHDNLKKCTPQSCYVGRVTDVHNGVVYIRLNNGVNAIAHSCYDLRTPGKKDDISFIVTRLDEEQGVAVGIITRIIKQNL